MDDISLNERMNQYDDMLDTTYSFERVGELFSHMKASSVLQICDIKAYNSGFCNWINAE